MTFPRRTTTATALLLAALHLAGAPAARAQGEAVVTDGATRAALVAERVRLRAELDRVNAEIDALKRGKRGMREDYRLRARLADAEALARRLSKIDAQLGPEAGGRAPRGPLIGDEPTLVTSDGPAEMDAKADILADQARRVETEAQTLGQRAQQLRARQDLRRRVGQMEHDPFSMLEGSKRRTATTTPGASPASSNSSSFAGSRAADQAGPAPPSGAIGQTTPTTMGGGGTALPPSPNVSVTTGSRGVASPVAAPVPAGGALGATDSALPAQLRDLLDPATLGEIRRLEASGAPGANLEALERAVAALRARAQKLESQSQALRSKAHPAR
jgi:hypothetical protein